MTTIIITALLVIPLICAGINLMLRNTKARKIIIGLLTAVLFAAAYEVLRGVVQGRNFFSLSPEGMPFDPTWIMRILELVVIGYIIYRGIKLKHIAITALAVLQLITLVLFEIFGNIKEAEVVFRMDYLSMILVLLVSIIGPLIAIFASGYMPIHEKHQKLDKSKQPGFFAVIFVFLGSMNGLAMADNLLWMYFFWEVTTLCSFLLISHDGNEMSLKNGARALWINLLGGFAFLCAVIFINAQLGTVSLSEVVERSKADGMIGLVPAAISLLSFAGFTKAAQFPFQSWLLGAMVAPTPVSALLHSSTMVKAGVYLIIRLSPVFGGTILGTVVAIAGGFTFMSASALAITQTNGKRVLAYSTVANLGLIICCAGIGTQVAVGAAILLMIFHALSKSLLFLCIGTIEQNIGSRDIEDMQGLMKKMPYTTIITVIGMISMLLPPFGVLLTKWLAIEAAVRMPAVLVLIIIGSAFTVVFWAKWIGIILTMSYKSKIKIEKLVFSMESILAILLVLVLAVSVGMAGVFNKIILPQLDLFKLSESASLAGNSGGLWVNGAKGMLTGGFASIPFFLLLFVLMFSVPFLISRIKPENVKPPYVGGELANDDIRGIEFTGPMDRVENAVVHNYYFSNRFAEKNIILVMNAISSAIILIMLGAVIK